MSPRLRIPGRGIVCIEGSHSQKFLQSYCTSDIIGWDRVGPIATAFLTRQGRVLADGMIYPGEKDDQILLEVAEVQKAALMKHLKLYKMRSAVTIRAASELTVSASGDTMDPRTKALGARAIIPNSLDLEDDSDYTRRRLTLGIGEGNELTNAIPLQCNFDLLGHICFKKGCYLGQELTARAFHRGTVRKRILPIALTSPIDKPIDRAIPEMNNFSSQLPPPGAKLKRFNAAENDTVGDIIATHGPVGLALFKLDFALGQTSVDSSIILDDSSIHSDLVVRPYLPEWWPAEFTSPPNGS